MTTTKLETLHIIMLLRLEDMTNAQVAYQKAKRDYHEEEARLEGERLRNRTGVEDLKP